MRDLLCWLCLSCSTRKLNRWGCLQFCYCCKIVVVELLNLVWRTLFCSSCCFSYIHLSILFFVHCSILRVYQHGWRTASLSVCHQTSWLWRQPSTTTCPSMRPCARHTPRWGCAVLWRWYDWLTNILENIGGSFIISSEYYLISNCLEVLVEIRLLELW